MQYDLNEDGAHAVEVWHILQSGREFGRRMVWIGRGIEIGLVTAYTGCRGYHLSNPLCGNWHKPPLYVSRSTGKWCWHG